MGLSLKYEMNLRDKYSEYKSISEEEKLKYLIHTKYLKVLGKFIENMYPGLKFDIFVKQRDPKQKSIDWFGNTYMELIIFDVITSPLYDPSSFYPLYSTQHYDGHISGIDFFLTINDFIPEINKHLLISFRPMISPHIEIHNVSFYDIPDFECWKEYFRIFFLRKESKMISNDWF